MNATANPPAAAEIDRQRVAVVLALRDHAIPEHMHGGLLRYLLDGIVPGSFLLALLTNDLAAAQAKADVENAVCFKAWLEVLKEMPTASWGHPRTVARWIERRGLNGTAGQDVTPKMGTPVLPKDPPVLSNRPKPSVLLALSAEIDKRVQDATKHLGEILARIPDGITADEVRYALNDLAIARTSCTALAAECRKGI